jgi:hypothetical protein
VDELDDFDARWSLSDEVTDEHGQVVSADVETIPEGSQFRDTAMHVTDNVDVLVSVGVDLSVVGFDGLAELWFERAQRVGAVDIFHT